MSLNLWKLCAALLLCPVLGMTAFGAEVGQESDLKIVYKEDLVYGRVHGAGLLADVAYPVVDRPLTAIISVNGGRWQSGHKQDGSTIKVKQWAGFGLFAMSIDYRLVGSSPAPAWRHARLTPADAG